MLRESYLDMNALSLIAYSDEPLNNELNALPAHLPSLPAIQILSDIKLRPSAERTEKEKSSGRGRDMHMQRERG